MPDQPLLLGPMTGATPRQLELAWGLWILSHKYRDLVKLIKFHLILANLNDLSQNLTGVMGVSKELLKKIR